VARDAFGKAEDPPGDVPAGNPMATVAPPPAANDNAGDLAALGRRLRRMLPWLAPLAVVIFAWSLMRGG